MLSNDVMVDIDHLSKLFYRQKQRTMKEMLPALVSGKRIGNWFWALSDITLQIKKGETLAIVGSNGSGKSTLLKMIAGVSKPTKGSITVNGRIAPLIELGAGFHPELTGKENVYLNGVILGMTHKEVDAKFKDIVDFAELWDFIDEPIKHYSSGMYLRLAFAVAVYTEPDILLIDEILVVGDQRFQDKCLKVIQSFKEKQIAIVMVSHASGYVEKLADRVCWIEHGVVQEIGTPDLVLPKYLGKRKDDDPAGIKKRLGLKKE